MVGTAEAGLLVDSKEGLYGAVNKVFVGEDGKRCRHADAVVGTEGCAVGAEPVAVDDGGDGAVGKVKALVVAFANHVHVSLQCNHGGVFVTRGARYAHDHVADFVGYGFDIVLCCEVEQVLAYFFLVFRGAWHVVNLVEDSKHVGRLEVSYCHRFFVFIVLYKVLNMISF